MKQNPSHVKDRGCELLLQSEQDDLETKPGSNYAPPTLRYEKDCPFCTFGTLSAKTYAGRPYWVCEDCGHSFKPESLQKPSTKPICTK
jgi:hypothetical protein